MPALNIIATQETVLNSGSSSSRPSGMLPNRLSASQSTNTTKPLEVSTNSQPVLAIVQPSESPETLGQRVGADEAPDEERDGDRGGDAEDDLVEACALGLGGLDVYVECGVRDDVERGLRTVGLGTRGLRQSGRRRGAYLLNGLDTGVHRQLRSWPLQGNSRPA